MTVGLIRDLSATMNIIDYFKVNAPWLLSGGIMTFASCFGQTFFISLFAAEIMAHYRITDGQWGALYAFGTIGSGLLMIWAGGLTDYFRVRLLAPILLILIALVCFTMSVNSYLWILPIIIFGLRFCGQGMLYHVAMVAMARWFTKTRGRAISIASLGFSISEASLPIIVVALLGYFSWQNIWFGSGFLALALIPILLILLKSERTPQEAARIADAKGIDDRYWTRKDALGHFLFWSLLPMLLMPPVLGTALFFQQVHFAESKGWTHASYVTLFPLFTIMSVASTLLFGWLVDRFGAVRLMPYYQIPFAVGLMVLSLSTSLFTAAIGLVLVASMHGGYTTTSVAFWAEVYGTKHLGKIKAAAAAVMVIGSGIGPWMSGGLIDRGHNFSEQLPYYSIAVLCACAVTYIACERIKPKLALTS